jgi:hypothetical protein
MRLAIANIVALRFSCVNRHMADSTDIPSSSSEPKKRVRGCTALKKINKVRTTGVKLKVEFDSKTGKCYGENSATFKSYVAFLARSTCSILIDDWPHVDESSKDSIWHDLKV